MSKNVVARDMKTVRLPEKAFSQVRVSAEALFTPMVRTNWLGIKTDAVAFGNVKSSFQIAGLATVVGGLFSLIGFDGEVVSLATEVGISAFAVGPLVTFFAYLPTLVFPVMHRRWRKQVLFAEFLNEQALKAWLDARYGIAVTDEVHHELTAFFSDGNSPASYDFVDVNGKAFTLGAADDGQYYVMETVKENVAISEYVVGVDGGTLTVVELRGEAKILYDNMMSRIALLLKRDLTLENKHVIARVQNDVRQVVQLNNDLVSLEHEDANIFVDVLSALNQEVNDILLSQVDEVRSQFAVQNLYVKSRQQRSVNSELVIQVQEPVAADNKV